MRTDGQTYTQTDIVNLTVSFRSFVKASRTKKYEVTPDYNFIDASVKFHSLLHTLPRKHKHISLSFFKRNQVKNNGQFTLLRTNTFYAHVRFYVDIKNTGLLVCSLTGLNWRESLVVLQM